jgi:hypothetical protein
VSDSISASVRDTADKAADAVKDAASSATDAVKDAGSAAADTAKKAGASVEKAADKAAEKPAAGVKKTTAAVEKQAATVEKKAAASGSAAKDAAADAKAGTKAAVADAKAGTKNAVADAKAAVDGEKPKPPQRSVSEIQAELDATRDRLAGRIDDLQEYVAPKNVANRQIAKVKGVFVDEFGGIKPDRVLIAAGVVVGLVVVVGISRRRSS